MKRDRPVFSRSALLLAALICALPAGRASALRVEHISRVSPSSGKTSYIEAAGGSVLVGFRNGVSTSAAAAQLEPAGFSVLGTLGRFNWSVVGLPAGMGVQTGLDLLKNYPAVEWAEPNRVYRAKKTSNDPYLPRQYALAQVQAFGAWEYETGFSSRVTVAVIDTGIYGSHPELQGKLSGTSMAFTPDFGTPSPNQPPTAACGHATNVAGVAAAATDNSIGVAGMSWGARLISFKVFDDSDCFSDCSDAMGQNSCSTSEVAIAAAVNEAIPLHNTPALGKIVINISLGSSGGCSNPLKLAVAAATGAGLMVVAAVGNEAASVADSPANCPGVIAAGATDPQDNLASFSNSDFLMAVSGLTAPGVDLFTTALGGGYASVSGTSFSSPMTAGLAALLWSAKPSYTAAQIFDLMKNSADDLGPPGPDPSFGWGRINALKAMRLAVTGSTQYAGARKAVAYPDPFRPKTQRLVSFTIPGEMTASGIEIKVYTSEGELVKKLDSLAWDGKNEAGAPVASGVYIFRIKTDKESAVGKLALLR